MGFNGTEGTSISLSTASSWTENWRNNKATGDPNAIFFGRDCIEDILNQTDCQGLRIYFGINDDDEKVLILVGADSVENDQTSGEIYDHGIPCPKKCGIQNDLNS